MRILLTADPELTVPPRLYGGVQRLVAQWVDVLVARGHTVGLIARAGSDQPCERLYSWPGNSSKNVSDTLRNALALLRAARDFRAEVVHSSSRLLYTWPLLLGRIPVVMTYHRAPGRRQIMLARRLGGDLAFTGVSDFITARGQRGGGNWRTVTNSIDLNRFTFEPEVSTDAPLLFLSRIDADKGADLAIQIARAANVPLILAGNHSADANAAHYWRDKIEPWVDGERIRFVGPVDDAAKNILLGRARALLVPTQCDEAFGLVFAEALACGTPAIGTHRGAVPEIIEHGTTGFLVDSIKDGTIAVLRAASLSRLACRRAAETKFALDKTVSEYESLYRELIANADRGRASSS